jgi:hypothetical protein
MVFLRPARPSGVDAVAAAGHCFSSFGVTPDAPRGRLAV